MSKKNNFDNTVLAMSEWLDERMDGYLMLLTKDGQSGMIMNGEADDVIDALASGMVDHEELRSIVLKAMGVAMHELEQIEPDDLGDINNFNMN